MSKIEVWGTGKPLAGFTQDAVLTNARKLFPTTKAQHIARFIAGKRFIITRVNDEAGAKKLIDGLAQSGIEADTAGPPPQSTGIESASAGEAMAEEEEPILADEADEASAELEDAPAPAPTASPKRRKIIAGVAAILVAGVAAIVFVVHRRNQADELAAQAATETNARAALAARLRSEAEAKKLADAEAAAKAKAAAEDAQRLANEEAAIARINSAFADGDYPAVIAQSERFEQMYGTDPRVTKLEDNATFTLQEGARRGNFGAILNAPIKGSVHFDALRQWALQAQERAKPVH